jgi:hypothetical protein
LWADAVAVTVAVNRRIGTVRARYRPSSEVVVRGGVEPPTFRFSGGLARPAESIAGCLSGPNEALALLGVHVQRHGSAAVVSKIEAAGHLTRILAVALRVSLVSISHMSHAAALCGG